MGKLLIVALFVVFMVQHSSAVLYIFQAPTYTLAETPGADNPTLTVMISRTEDNSTLVNQARQLTLTTTCPSGVTANATATSDYIVDLTVNFEAGKLEAPVNITIVGDSIEETTEFFCLTIPTNNGSQYTIIVLIPDNDSEFSFVTGATLTIPEGETRDVEIRRAGSALQKTLEIVIAPTSAAYGGDFTIIPAPVASVSSSLFIVGDSSNMVTITTVGDLIMEGTETFTLTLRDPLVPNGDLGNPHVLTVTIADDDALYNWKTNIYNGYEGTTSAVCLIRNVGVGARTVLITSTSVSAIAGTDFVALTSIQFEGTELEKCVVISLLADSIVESTETFRLTINTGQDGVLVGTNNVATVSIYDDDVEVGWVQTVYTFAEGSAVDNTRVFLYKSGTGPVDVTIQVASTTAREGTDFSILAKTFTITEPSYAIPVTIVNDSENEGSETFIITLSTISRGTRGTSSQTTVTITDPNQPTSTSGDGIGAGAIAAITAGVVGAVVLAAIAVGVFCMATGGLSPSSAAAPAVATASSNALAPSVYGNGLSGFGQGMPNQGYNFI